MKDLSQQDLKQNVPLAAKQGPEHQTVVQLGDAAFGSEQFVVIAGPCAVESSDQVADIAENVKGSGARVLRGGAFKPLTFPYRNDKMFELREEGLRYLHDAGASSGLPVVTEVMDVALVDTVAQHADMLQIGTRNMQNFPLLEAVAAAGKPVLLKRHFGCSLRDWLGAAEYVLHSGNPNVVLCERGVVAPHTHVVTSRFIVDLQAVLAAKEATHLPVIVDPSHSTFRRTFVAPVARASLAIGADGILLDVHPVPEEAAVDPLQALSYTAFEELMGDLRKMAPIVDRVV